MHIIVRREKKEDQGLDFLKDVGKIRYQIPLNTFLEAVLVCAINIFQFLFLSKES